MFRISKSIVLDKKQDLVRIESDSKKNVLRGNLILPPSVNKMYLNTGKGGRRLSPQVEVYYSKMKSYLAMLIEDQQFEMGQKGEWLYLDLYFFFPDRINRDSHNTLKALLDAMQDRCFVNDYFIMPRIHTVELDKENPRVFFELYRQTEEDRQKALQYIGSLVY